MDRFNAILERFSAAIDSLSKKKSAPAPPPVSSGGGGGTQKKKDPPSSPSSPGAAPGKLSETATASPTAEGQVKAAGFDQADFGTFRDVIASKESGGRYDIQGGSGNSYSGRYQLGAAARQDAARFLGEKYQGDSDSARATFRKDPEMQERYFAAYTRANDSYLKGTPEYDALDKRGKLEVLAYAHNAGAGNAIKWLKSGRQGSFRDGNNTKSSDYSKEVKAAFGGAAPPKLQQAAVTVKPGVTPAGTPAATQQQIAQTVAQPPPQQQPQVTVAPMNMSTPQPQSPPSSGGGQPAQMSSGRQAPPMGASNDDNFFILYSKMVYSIVDG